MILNQTKGFKKVDEKGAFVQSFAQQQLSFFT